MPSQTRAGSASPVLLDQSEKTDRLAHADWSAYARAYDLLSEHNPEYKALLQDFETFLTTIEPPELIYDIGGGTGNYTQIAARCCPESEIRFVEPDTGMTDLAKAKLAEFGNVSFQTCGLEGIEAQGKADLIICVHALYAMPAQEQRLGELRRLLRPGGLLYLIDLGRYMDVADWRGYLFRSLREKLGLLGALRVFWQGREIAKQNTSILNAQKKGVYWTHTSEEMASAVTDAGFEILRQQPVYRGYSDLLVCRAVCVEQEREDRS